MGTMTYDEAVDQVLSLKDKIGRMPTHEDYKKILISYQSRRDSEGS